MNNSSRNNMIINFTDYLKYKSSTPKDAIAKTESRSLVHFSEEQLVQHKDTSTEDHSQESTNINGANLDGEVTFILIFS